MTSRRSWLVGLPWWHAAFAATVALTVGYSVVDTRSGGRLAAVLAVYAAFVFWYLAAPVGFVRRTPGIAYLVGVLVLYLVALVITPDASFLLFVLIPQCFVILETRPAWMTVIGLSLASSASQLAHESISRGDVTAITIFGVTTIASALLITGWVTKISEQSQQRADLIDELDRTRSELARVSHDAGTAAERQRLAGEIHDTLAQGFTSIVMLLQAAQATLTSGPVVGGASAEPTEASVRAQLALAESTARDGLAEARSLIAALAPVALQSGTLVDAVRRVVDDFGDRTGTRVRLEVTGTPAALPAADEVVLLRATQEALTNVARHAGAGTAAVTLAYGVDGPRLTVSDDGRGFSPDPVPDRSYGLRGMRARVEQAGGCLQVRSSPGAGTTVELTLPAAVTSR